MSTDGYNSVHLNDNGVSAICLSQHTLTPAIITSERLISPLWDSDNKHRAFPGVERCNGWSRDVFYGTFKE